jgi:hypothetical protein
MGNCAAAAVKTLPEDIPAPLANVGVQQSEGERARERERESCDISLS